MAIGIAERTIITEKTTMSNHADHLVTKAVVWIVLEKALPCQQLGLHGANMR